MDSKMIPEAAEKYIYYREPGIVLLHGDCRDILPLLEPEKNDLMLTDPPYGINYRPDYGNRRMPNGGRMFRTTAPAVKGDEVPFNPEFLFEHAREFILWGANHYRQHLPKGGSFLIWDKRCQVIPPRCQSDCEIAWISKAVGERIFYHIWDGMIRASEKKTPKLHPTQKPLALMDWCIEFMKDARRIIDPFMGSGPIAEAAKFHGIEYIGIEIEAEYIDKAIGRLRQSNLLSAAVEGEGERQEGLFGEQL